MLCDCAATSTRTLAQVVDATAESGPLDFSSIYKFIYQAKAPP
jgi:hypothetical protein